jgi:hypothetical protein
MQTSEFLPFQGIRLKGSLSENTGQYLVTQRLAWRKRQDEAFCALNRERHEPAAGTVLQVSIAVLLDRR